jgi:hypothetical protein
MQQPAGLAFQVKRMTWAAMGGPKRLMLEAVVAAERVDLAVLLALARCPVEVYTEDRQMIWWGLVWGIMVEEGAAGVRVSLDDLANRVRVVYGEMKSEVQGTGRRNSTAWFDDVASQSDYGVKEGQFELALASVTQAESYRALMLASSARPVARARFSSVVRPGGVVTITLECRGWWETLAWRRYSQVAGLVENIGLLPPAAYSMGTVAVGDLAQRIIPAVGGWTAEVVWVSLRRTTYATTGTFTVYFCAESAGPLPGTVLATATLDISTLPVSNPGWVAFYLSAPVLLSAGVGYWIVIRSSTSSATAHVRALVDTGLGYTPGGLVYWDVAGAAWVDVATADLQFRVAGRMETSEQVKLALASGAGGQFLSGMDVAASGLYTNPFRNGDLGALAEVEQLLWAGNSSSVPMYGQVTPQRAVVVRARPVAGSCRYKIGRDGVIRLLGGQKAPAGNGVAGEWAALDTFWGVRAAGLGVGVGRVFLEEVEYSNGGVRCVSW